jgi:hypothetical protein
VSDQVSHPYKTTNIIIFLYILIFNFLKKKTGRKVKKSIHKWNWDIVWGTTLKMYKRENRYWCFIFRYKFVLPLQTDVVWLRSQGFVSLYSLYYDIIYDMMILQDTIYDVIYDMIYDMTWYDMIWYDKVRYDMVYDTIDRICCYIWYYVWYNNTIWYVMMIW